jgi:hypothetical protein
VGKLRSAFGKVNPMHTHVTYVVHMDLCEVYIPSWIQNLVWFFDRFVVIGAYFDN